MLKVWCGRSYAALMIAKYSKEETLDSILRHNQFINRELASLAYEEVHKEWGPVLDLGRLPAQSGFLHERMEPADKNR